MKNANYFHIFINFLKVIPEFLYVCSVCFSVFPGLSSCQAQVLSISDCNVF